VRPKLTPEPTRPSGGETSFRLADETLDGEETMVQPSPRTRQYVADFADSDALFPWKDMPFMIVKTVNSELKKLLGMRITVRSDLECS
jgi:hypothetical protein